MIIPRVEEVLEGMQKTQQKLSQFQQDNFKTFYCHVCMANLYDECNDIRSDPEEDGSSKMDCEPAITTVFEKARSLSNELA